jgi:hypothetical protein
MKSGDKKTATTVESVADFGIVSVLFNYLIQ